MQRDRRIWEFGPHRFAPGDRPRWMGIVNVTPDSFSDGGSFLEPAAAVERALQLCDEGADILDVGGESTRPGAEPVEAADELRRVLPVVERLAASTNVPISIDTYKAAVAREALAAGASIVNDISGLTLDSEMAAVCAETGAGVVCMHIQGNPQTMQRDPTYDNVVADIRQFFESRLGRLIADGLLPEQILLDPGIGFGKTAAHNLEILSHVREFRSLGRPVLIGHSRKRFLKKLVGRSVEERLAGTIGVSIALALQEVDVIRVHDVRANRDAVLAFQTIAAQLEQDGVRRESGSSN